MSEVIIVAILSLAGTCIGSFMSNRKTAALVDYRLQQLEEKVNKHNNLIERMYSAEETIKLQEHEIKVANHRIDDLEQFHK